MGFGDNSDNDNSGSSGGGAGGCFILIILAFVIPISIILSGNNTNAPPIMLPVNQSLRANLSYLPTISPTSLNATI
jgi:hypothetical protein